MINDSLLFMLKDMCAFNMCVLSKACAIVYVFYQKFSTPKYFPKIFYGSIGTSLFVK